MRHVVDLSGEPRAPWPHAASAPIARDDIVAVAATALLDEAAHAHRAHALTGPETLRRTALVERIAAALEEPVGFVEVPRDEAVAVLEPVMGADAGWYVDAVLGGFAEHTREATPIVEELTGRLGTTFAEWAVAHADDFRRHEHDDGPRAVARGPSSEECLSPGSRAAPGSGWGGAASTSSWTRSAGSAHG